LAKLYAVKGAPKDAAAAERFCVEPHRFGMSDVRAAAEGAAFQQDIVDRKTAEWENLDLDWSSAVSALQDTKADVTYEELEGLGLNTAITDRLVAILLVKRPSGYCGDLSKAGSWEHVAFWADWDDTGEWSYLDTVRVKVHDIDPIPAEGLSYAAILPVDLDPRKTPRQGRVRAVLSWATPPSSTDPEEAPHWGNSIDQRVVVPACDGNRPGETPAAEIGSLSGIPVGLIETAADGRTKPGAYFFHNMSPADRWGRACPFGGVVLVHGKFHPGFWYRVRARNRVAPFRTVTLDGAFNLPRWQTPPFSDTQVATNSFFQYADPLGYKIHQLARWPTSGDELWQIQLEIATAPDDASIVVSSPRYNLQLDNTRPMPASHLDIHIDAGGDGKEFDKETLVTGTFVARDENFGGWSLSTHPNTTLIPSNQPTTAPALAPSVPTDDAALESHAWSLDTGKPVKMKPGAYVIRLDVWDRSIVNSLPGHHNRNHVDVGFRLRKKTQ
jgi:hypothetical protein